MKQSLMALLLSSCIDVSELVRQRETREPAGRQSVSRMHSTCSRRGEARQWSRRLERCGLLRGCTDTERVRVPCVVLCPPQPLSSLLDARIPTRFLCTRSTRQGTSSDARPPSLRPARPQLCEGKKPQTYSVSCNTTLMTEAMTRGKHE